MKKLFILLTASMSILNYIYAQQNLVPNPSFEDYSQCPVSYAQIDRAVNWSSYKLTPDYFNSCNTTTAGVPSNYFGYQSALTGNAFVGFSTFAKYTNNFREIIGSKLNHPLSIGNKYYVTFYVNRASNILSHNNGGTNKIGVRFSTVAYSYNNPAPIDNFSQVYTDSLITDTLNWVEISGSFVADSTYLYLSIGNFFTDSATTHVLYDSTAAFAYYYVEDISVYEDSTTKIKEYDLNKSIRLFPNPVQDYITIEGKGITSIEVIDVYGNIFLPADFIANSFINNINTTFLLEGIYTFKINTLNKSVFKKILIQKP